MRRLTRLISLVLLVWRPLVDAQPGKLAFSGCEGICIMDPMPGAMPVSLVEGLYDKIRGGVWYMDMSPDGGHIAFTDVYGGIGFGCVWAMRRNGTDLRLLACQDTKDQVLLIREVFWSPDGDEIAYLSHDTRMWLTPVEEHPDGPEARFLEGRLTQIGMSGFEAWWEWLPDGRVMYVGYTRDAVLREDWSIFILDLDTRDRKSYEEVCGNGLMNL